MGNKPSPLRKAIRWSELEKVKRILNDAGDRAPHLINHDYSPDCIMDSCTRAIGNAFYYAVGRNRLPIINVLLQHGADPYSTGRCGETCLHLAARLNYLETGRILLKCGVNVKTTDDEGRYAIHCACMTIFDTTRFIDFLLEEAEEKSDVNARDFYNRIPLHESAFIGNIEVVRTLIRHGADVNAIDKSGNTPLHESRKRGHTVWKYLIDNGADLTIKNNRGLTPEQMPHWTSKWYLKK